jgi:hypothetical protein
MIKGQLVEELEVVVLVADLLLQPGPRQYSQPDSLLPNNLLDSLNSLLVNLNSSPLVNLNSSLLISLNSSLLVSLNNLFLLSHTAVQHLEAALDKTHGMEMEMEMVVLNRLRL